MDYRMRAAAALQFFKNWMLVIGMSAGVALYVIYRMIPALHPAGGLLLGACQIIQPVLLFVMLFLTFSKIEPRDLRPHRWQWRLLLVQAVCFIVPAVILALFPDIPCRIGIEALMLCFITPTATACSVVTERLGGNAAGILTYTILINLLDALLVPLVVPFVHPVEGLNFFQAFCLILAKVFPLLILPCLCAWLVRYLFPRLHTRLMAKAHLSFYIWAFALTLAILMSARALYHNEGSATVVLEIALAALLSCAFQFYAGKRIGAAYDNKKGNGAGGGSRASAGVGRITAGQALGQKNTVFGIWMGYTFLTPVVALCGGFYSIFHNCYNTWQLRHLSRPNTKQI